MIELVGVDDVAAAVRAGGLAPGPGAAGPPPVGGGTGSAAPTASVAERPGGTVGDLVVDGVEELVRAVVASNATDGDGSPPDPRWGTYFGVDPETRRVVGTCGFRGVPRGGKVEVAFWTFPPFEGRGWATAMARALVDRALTDPGVEVVLAHTLPERAPATSVLTAAGLRLTDAVRRDERTGPAGATVRGRVWRWERRRRG